MLVPSEPPPDLNEGAVMRKSILPISLTTLLLIIIILILVL